MSETLYRDRVVRDLAWAIGSPPLMRLESEETLWPAALWYRSLLDDFADQLRRLDDDPAALHGACDPEGELQGHYFESLWEFWLRTNTDYRLVERGVQVRDEGRTVGELDFIVFNTRQDVYEHWEVAVKFFLGCGPTASPSFWYGPNQADKLSLKVERLVSHQTQLSKTAPARRYLQEKKIEIARTRVVMKGRLFYPREVQSETVPPFGAGPAHERGWWTTAEGFESAFRGDQRRWAVLPKRDWFAPVRASEVAPLGTGTRRATELKRQCRRGPKCVAAFVAEQEVERGFVVPSSWVAGLYGEQRKE